MPIDSQELARRLAEADRMRLLLRQTTNELAVLGQEILKNRQRVKEGNLTTTPAPAEIEILPRPSKPKTRSGGNVAESRE